MGSISILSINLELRRKNSLEPGFEPGAAGWEARMLPLCFKSLNPLNNNERQFCQFKQSVAQDENGNSKRSFYFYDVEKENLKKFLQQKIRFPGDSVFTNLGRLDFWPKVDLTKSKFLKWLPCYVKGLWHSNSLDLLGSLIFQCWSIVTWTY